MAEKISILEFVGDILPQQNVNLGKGSFTIKAMQTGTIISVALQLKELVKSLGEQGVTWENYNSHESLAKISLALIQDFPALLSDMTGIVEEDLKLLPPDVLLQIVSAAIEVNTKSKDTFLKNWQSLVESAKSMKLITVAKDDKPTTKKSSKS